MQCQQIYIQRPDTMDFYLTSVFVGLVVSRCTSTPPPTHSCAYFGIYVLPAFIGDVDEILSPSY